MGHGLPARHWLRASAVVRSADFAGTFWAVTDMCRFWPLLERDGAVQIDPGPTLGNGIAEPVADIRRLCQ